MKNKLNGILSVLILAASGSAAVADGHGNLPFHYVDGTGRASTFVD